MLRFFNNPVPESALAYCRSLALQVQRAFGHALTPEVWTSIMGTQVPDPTRVAYGLLAEKYLAPNVAAQARLAALLEYPPSKWLLEREMEARGNWPGPNHPPNTPPPDVYQAALGANLKGVCFSGGGIRSATFNLGVLQAIAAEGKLGNFDYLSTVSGGGYIHLFLASWIHRKKLAHVQAQLRPLPADSARTAWPEPIRWLRRYSNYLTPSKGLFTADTWAASASGFATLSSTKSSSSPRSSPSSCSRISPCLRSSASTRRSSRPTGRATISALPRRLCSHFLSFLVAAIAVGVGLFKTPHPTGTTASRATPTDEAEFPGSAEVLAAARFSSPSSSLSFSPSSPLRLFSIAPPSSPCTPWDILQPCHPARSPSLWHTSTTWPHPKSPFPLPLRPAPPLSSFVNNETTWFNNYEPVDFWTPFSERQSSVFTAFALGIGLLALAFVGAVPLRKGQSILNAIKVVTLVTAALVSVIASLLLLHFARVLLLLAAIALTTQFVDFSIVFAPILLLWVLFISLDLAIGVVGRLMLDSSREWLARVRSFSFISGFAWLGLPAVLSSGHTSSLSSSISSGKGPPAL